MHQEYILTQWSKLHTLEKLPLDKILNIKDSNARILLLEFYDYLDEIKKIDSDVLMGVRTNNNDNLYLSASYNGHIATLQYLVSIGFDVWSKNFHGTNAYSLAAYGGHIETMKYLESISTGIDIKAVNRDGNNAFLFASKNGKVEVMKWLEKKGFDISIKNNYGNNAYLVASYNEHVNVMEWLENKGININIKNEKGEDAYMYAVANNKKKVIDHFEKKIVSNIKIKNVHKIVINKSDTNVCAICQENEKDFVCIPCGHLYMCGICANTNKMEKCIMCSRFIDSIYKVYC
jgi:ankyrin repeat protein